MRLQILVKTQLKDAFTKAAHIVEEEMENALDDLALRAVAEARRRAPVDTGHLRRSIAVEKPGKFMRRVGSGVKYAPYIEFGTRPHWPPYEPIREWVWRNRRKFGIGGASKAAHREVDRVAFLVQRKIARRGTPAREYMKAAFLRVKEVAERIFAHYVRNIVRRMSGG